MARDIFGRFGSQPGTDDSAPVERGTGPVAVVALVADVEGVAGRAVTRRIVDFLAAVDGIDVRTPRRSLKVPGDVGLVEKLTAATTIGRSWLAGEGADVLVWAEAVGTEGGAVIRFLPALADAEGKTGAFGLGDALDLPSGFGDEFGDIIATVTVAAAVPVKAEREEALARLLRAAVGQIGGYVDAPPAGLSPSQTVALLACLGNCFASLWRVAGDDAYLDRAVAVYKAAIDACPYIEMRLQHALLQNHLAAAHEALAVRHADDGHLEEAAKAYHAVSAVLGQGDHPSDWAFAQGRLGAVLYRLALHRNSDPSHLKAAIKAFEAAREVLTRDEAPERWAEVTNQMGVALMALGIQVAGTEALEQSVGAFRGALEVRRRDAAPLLWAQTANNLGAASFALARRKPTPGLLEEAVRCFEGARQIYGQYRQAKTVAVIEKNLTRVREQMARG